MGRGAAWGAALAGVLLLRGFAVRQRDGDPRGAPPTVTVYKTPT
jgi:hypothetical protein